MEYFSIVAKWVSEKAAQSSVSFAAFLIVLVWGIAGLPLHFNVIWHLMISTLAAVISIIMLFIIQNSQNRHTIAIQLKLDEIIRATKGAHNEMMDIEKLTDEDLARIQKKYGLLAEKTKEDLKEGKLDTHTPDISTPIKVIPRYN
ncbi:MAG: low affinity iron permease family protein [Candidatus Omnitrophota bacterium]|nr:low affinity iron permease family protein [Candidatus Omnitrophota bacterium]